MNIGLINDTNISDNTNIAISNYFYAINNLFSNVKLINKIDDLKNIDCLFIGNDHRKSHLDIWNNNSFINYCNNNNIKVAVYTAERIQSSYYPWNYNIQEQLEKFKFLHQRVIDVDDAIKFNKKIARCSCSLYYKDIYKDCSGFKKNKIVFFGLVNNREYIKRFNTISTLKKYLDIDIIYKDYNISWKEYIKTISSYKFILSPYSLDCNCFHLKFYEALLVNSIPIHQIYSNTLDYYPVESTYSDSIYFINSEEVIEKINNFNLLESYNKPWLEDELIDFFINDVGIKF